MSAPAPMIVPERTERGSDSRLPPNMEAGARAFIEALVSTELRRRRLEEDARVRIEASSVRMLLAVAEWYVVGCPWGARCAGTAVAGCPPNWAPLLLAAVDVAPRPVGWLLLLLAGAAIDCTVVRVVAMERTDGAGDENVLSLPPSVLVVAVAPVPAPEGAASERAVSACVASVGAFDLFPPFWLSWEMEMECLLCECEKELCLDR